MKALGQPEKLIKLDANKNADSSQDDNSNQPQKTENNSKKDESKNTPVELETTDSVVSNDGQKSNKTPKKDELDIKEETTPMTVEYYDRHMDYIDRRIAKKLLSGGGKSRKDRRKSRSDFSKEVREIIDEAIERDKK